MTMRSPSNLFHTAILVLLAASAPFLACGPEPERQEMGAQETTLESAGRETAVAFPPSAKLLGVHRERGIDSLIAVKVEMPAQDWPGFLAKLPVDPNLFLPGERGLLGPDEGFWDPGKAGHLQTVQADLPDARVLNVGYDDSRPGLVVVYVVNHGQ